MAARTSLIVLIAAAYVGGAVALHLCWQHSFLSALVAAPLGGSLAVLAAALLLFLRNSDGGIRPIGSAERTSHRAMGRAN